MNQEFVRDKVMKQLKNLATKNRAKRNKNKDKKVQKANMEIRESVNDC